MKYLYFLLFPIFVFGICNGTPYSWQGTDAYNLGDGCRWEYQSSTSVQTANIDSNLPFVGKGYTYNNNEMYYYQDFDGSGFSTSYSTYKAVQVSIVANVECTITSSLPICAGLGEGNLTYLSQYGNNTDTQCLTDGNIEFEISNTPDDSIDDYYGCFSFVASSTTNTSDTNTSNSDANSSTNTGGSGNTDTGTGSDSNTENTDTSVDNTGDIGSTGGDTGGTTNTGGSTASALSCQENAHYQNQTCVCDDGYYNNGFGWCFLNAPDLPETPRIDTNTTNGIDINPLVDAINTLNTGNHNDAMNISNRNHTDLSSIDSSIIASTVSTNLHLSDIENSIQNSSNQNHSDLTAIQNTLEQLNSNLTSENNSTEFDDKNLIEANNNTTQSVNALLDFLRDGNGTNQNEVPISEGTTSDLSNAVTNLQNSLSDLDISEATLETTIKDSLEGSLSDFSSKGQNAVTDILDEIFIDIFNPMNPFEDIGKNLNNFIDINLPIEISSIEYTGHIIFTQAQIFGTAGSDLARFYLILQVVLQLIAVLAGFFYLIKGVSNV